MNKNFLWVPVVVAFCACVAAACDETIGDCYPVGQSAGSGDPGVGATGTTGSGPGPDGLTMTQCNGSDNGGSDTPSPTPPKPACFTSDWGPADGTTYDYCDPACMSECGPVPLMGTFSASIFKFVTTLPDDGKDDAGGWQVANATLTFDRWTGLLPESWTCDVAVGFPLRTKAYGVISPAYAAVVSADIANRATDYLMHNPNEIPQGVFCALLPGTMNTALAADPVYKGLGGRVTKKGAQ